MRKLYTQGQNIPLQRYKTPIQPFEQLHVDCVTGFVTTTRGHSSILVMKDKLTKWVELVPLPNLKAKTVAKAIVENIYCRHGAPKVLISDNGKEFSNGLLTAIDNLLKYQHKYTTPYHPEANGQVENHNKTLKDMLSGYTSKYQTDWDEYISLIQHAYNTTVNDATGYSPFRALYGREATQTTDAWISSFTHTEPETFRGYVSQLQEVLLHTWSDMAAIIDHSLDKRDELLKHRNTRVFRPYQPKDTFYMKSNPKLAFIDQDTKEKHKLNLKLQYRWTGPHEVLEVINPTTYYCLVDGKKRALHVSKMKPNPNKLRTANRLEIHLPESDPLIVELDEEDDCTVVTDDDNMVADVD
jgi:hypothetical protein